MKRTLKRGLKVREIAKREAIGFSMGTPLNRAPCGYKMMRRVLVNTDTYASYEAFVGVLLLGRASQHRFA